MSDKVYELPDHGVALVWQNDKGDVRRFNPEHRTWYTLDGHVLPTANQIGRWLPWTPPTFAPRVKCPRRCWATCSEGRGVFIFFPNHVDRKFRPAFKECSGFVEGSSLTDIVWIDKEEYEDELQGCTHGDVSRSS